jgi:hypothetical protein
LNNIGIFTVLDLANPANEAAISAILHVPKSSVNYAELIAMARAICNPSSDDPVQQQPQPQHLLMYHVQQWLLAQARDMPIVLPVECRMYQSPLVEIPTVEKWFDDTSYNVTCHLAECLLDLNSDRLIVSAQALCLC